MKKLFPVLAVCLVLLLEASVCSQAAGYVTHVLSAEGRSWASDINDLGQIAGGVQNAGRLRAALWDHYQSVPQWLDGENRRPTARLINNAGLVVGEHEGLPGVINLFLWDATSGVTDVPTASIFPLAVNDGGAVVGWLSGTTGNPLPVAMDSTGHLTCLEILAGCIGGEARDINDAGSIVGTSDTPGWGGYACMWQAGEPVINIGTFGGTWSNALGVNNAGQVVGVYGDDNSAIGNYLWSRSGGVTFIPSCPLFDDGLMGCIGINDSGVVLGQARIGGVQMVVTWSQAGGYTVAGKGEAYAINNSGWIAGVSDINDPHALVWEPVPEPSSLLALAGGLGCLAALRGNKRRRTA